MKSWLHRMLAEIDAVSDEQANSVPVDDEICPHEYVVGELTPELKKIRFLFRQYRRRECELRVALQFSSTAEEAALMEEHMRFQIQADILGKIFWTSCREEFPELWGKESIGIRAGCKAVWSDYGGRAADYAAIRESLEELLRGADLSVH